MVTIPVVHHWGLESRNLQFMSTYNGPKILLPTKFEKNWNGTVVHEIKKIEIVMFIHVIELLMDEDRWAGDLKMYKLDVSPTQRMPPHAAKVLMPCLIFFKFKGDN
jgi:hypothetical protein